MRGRILQLNISPGGMPKHAVLESEITPRGLVGDVQRNLKYHGGPDQALLLITQGALDEICALGWTVYPGALGENLTVTGLDRRQLRIGQRLRAGLALIEITKLRQPCRHLDVYGPGIQAAVYAKKALPGEGPWGLAGFYCRVLQAGAVFPGDVIEVLDQAV
ncbi:MAG: MOSC domain-containing protein [Bryobacteraceae bacterium]|nr:MOSC domain-containing protein [Bryobacteraceae bacterium]